MHSSTVTRLTRVLRWLIATLVVVIYNATLKKKRFTTWTQAALIFNEASGSTFLR